MVDSGAAFSLFPLSGLHCVHDGTPLQPCTTNAILSSIGGGKLSIVGSLFLSLDLGFSKLFSFSFHVTDQLNYGILGADFLSHHRLNVNMALQRLSETVEIDRCIPDEPYSEPSAYKISSDSESNCNLLNDMQQEFPEVFDCNKRKHFVKHSDLNSILPDPERFVIDYMEMASEQRNDQEVQNLKSNNGTGLRLEEVLLSDTGLTILCDNSQGRLRPVIPKSMRFAVFRHFHSTSHPGVRAGIKLISRLVVWYDMRRDITRWTRECQQCARSKVYRHSKAPLQIVMPPPKGRFTHIYVDLTGPLPSSKGYTYIMVIIDRFSRFFQAVPLTGITADECINAFIRHWVSLFGCPEHIYTDRGKQFTSNLWLKMCHHLGSKSHQSTAYHPQAQGIVERLNRTLKTSLKCQEDASQWYDRLPWVMLALRNMPKQDLSDSTPSELVFGQPVRLPGEFFEESSATNMPDDHFSDNLAKFIQSIKFFPSRTSNHPTYVDPALFNPATTHVYIRVDRRLPPLHPTYTGPYQVIQQHNKYFELNMRTHTERVTIDRLKPAYLSISTLNQNSSFIQSHLPTTVEVNLQTPLSNSDSPHINTPRQPSITPQTYTRRGRKINVPSRYADYETDF